MKGENTNTLEQSNTLVEHKQPDDVKCKKIKKAKKKKARDKHNKEGAEAQVSVQEAKASKVSASFETRVSFWSKWSLQEWNELPRGRS